MMVEIFVAFHNGNLSTDEVTAPTGMLRDKLQALADHIDSLPSSAWTEESLRNSNEWRVLRQLAADALASFPR